MGILLNCGIEHPSPKFTAEHEVEIRKKLDTYLDFKMEEWRKNVPYADHLQSKQLHLAWYRRHLIEHVWRIRLNRVAHSRALTELTKLSPEAAQLYAAYQSEEMNHDVLFWRDCEAQGVTRDELYSTTPFLATKLLAGFFYYLCEHEGPVGVVSASYLIEYTTAKLTPKQVSALRDTVGAEKITGQTAHLETDLGDDHAGEMWAILRYLISSDADVERVLRYFDDIQNILAMYFKSLYEQTVEEGKEAA